MTAICWPTYPESDTDLTWPDLTSSLLVIRSISQGFHLLSNVWMSYKISYQSRRLTKHYGNNVFPAGSYISSGTQDNVRLNDNSCFRIKCKSLSYGVKQTASELLPLSCTIFCLFLNPHHETTALWFSNGFCWQTSLFTSLSHLIFPLLPSPSSLSKL